MKKIFVLLLFFTLCVQASTTIIVLESLETKKEAFRIYKEIKTKTSLMYELSKINDFSFTVKKTSKKFIVVAQDFKNDALLEDSLIKLQNRFEGAYIFKYKSSKKVKSSDFFGDDFQKVKEELTELFSGFKISYVLFFIIGSVLLYYFIKFKRIYDQY
ncbi:hypothetical protein JHD48_04695 [Sulfurimonas sp. SAG-AH-194-I05]|nr:hypothetical protein [Sulfurimonas sp. SAG-AH-194-I05]MDF1875027.1 hypothetical protein [Sulfurimonas sp. SAG-AH-194-I05]